MYLQNAPFGQVVNLPFHRSCNTLHRGLKMLPLIETNQQLQSVKSVRGIMLRMKATSSNEVTQLLQAWGNGNKEALYKLMPFVYEELHRLAASYMRKEGPGHTLQSLPTHLADVSRGQSSSEAECSPPRLQMRPPCWHLRSRSFNLTFSALIQICVNQTRNRRVDLEKIRGAPGSYAANATKV